MNEQFPTQERFTLLKQRYNGGLEIMPDGDKLKEGVEISIESNYDTTERAHDVSVVLKNSNGDEAKLNLPNIFKGEIEDISNNGNITLELTSKITHESNKPLSSDAIEINIEAKSDEHGSWGSHETVDIKNLEDFFDLDKTENEEDEDDEDNDDIDIPDPSTDDYVPRFDQP